METADWIASNSKTHAMLFEQENNLYGTGWIDLVFANRNQQYGAYALRKEYPRRLATALLLTVTVASGALIAAHGYDRARRDAGAVVADKPDAPDERVLEMKKIREIPKRQPAAVATPVNAPKHASTVARIPAAVPAEDVLLKQPEIASADPVNDLPVGAAAGVATTGSEGGGQAGGSEGRAEAAVENGNTVFETAEVNPQFPGGQEAFARFIRKNLNYPGRAAELGIGGRVYVSFIVEKDGKVTDVALVRGIGYGCDEEALRVLKKAPAWIPGMQNGRNVRVRFTVPLHFSVQN